MIFISRIHPRRNIMPKIRYTIPDALRGLSLVSMIIYHAMWDIVYIFGVSAPWYQTKGAFIWQQSICWTFIILSGFCWHFGSHKLKRGLMVLAGAVIINAVTVLLMPQNAVRYGVLSLIAAGMLLLIPMDKLLRKINPYAGMLLSAGLFFITRNIPSRSLGFGSLILTDLPHTLYSNNFTAWLGFPHADFHSTDYFPLLPWFFLYLAGYFLYYVFRRLDILKHLSAFSIGPLEFLGRHSLIIYLLHQPVIYGILQLFFLFAA